MTSRDGHFETAKTGPARHGAAVDIVSLGCRLNAYEGEVVRAHAEAAGLSNLIVVNTCAVTGEAMRQAAQTVRRLKRERPDATVLVTGCGAQLDPSRFADMPEVDHVVGNAEKMNPATFTTLARNRVGSGDASSAAEEARSPRVRVSDIMRVRETAHHLLDGFAGRARATVEIQNGCDHRCTFCIIPFARGPSRSHPVGAVVERVRRHVADGYAEVVLTGVDITSYGGDLPGAPSLGKLVQAILAEVPDLTRLRLSSIDQVEADDALMEAIASEHRLMPHLHLSLQSGDDMILKRMKRRHLRADAERFCESVRRVRPDIAFGADIIAGFPTETDAAFEASLEMIETCGITYVHAFPFSSRPGTPAARMPQVGRAIAKERASRLRKAGDARLSAHLAGLVGSLQQIVVEAGNLGRTPQFAEVRFDPALFTTTGPTPTPDGGSTPRHGALLNLRMARLEGRTLVGTPP